MDASAVTILFSLTGLVALAKITVDMVRYVQAKKYAPVVYTVLAVAVGIGGAFLLGASDLGAGVNVGGSALGVLNSASKVLLGLGVGVVASLGANVLNAIDNTKSTAITSVATDVANGEPQV